MTPVATVLIAEDDDVDAIILERVLKRTLKSGQVVRARDGEDALDMLHADDETRLPRPVVIVTDINMPRMNGIELLAAIRRTNETADMVCFVVTTSTQEDDLEAAYEHHVAGVIVKDDVSMNYTNLSQFFQPYFDLVRFPAS